ncbi:PIG-L family deacetylase [Candidatus Woesearchaeota archaeon]|nr:PIG-L family deacetylase [Candidatus Woesearchaeota archaeon]
MRHQKTVLCICAHSDDQIFGPGGTLAKHAKEGKKVYTVILSYGEKSHPHFKEGVITKIRVEEARAADEVIGGSGVIFFGMKEGRFRKEAEEKDIVPRLIDVFKQHDIDRIYTHASDDPHTDHKATFAIVKEAYDKGGLSCPLYTFDVWTPFSTQKRDAPKLVMDVSDTYRKKLKALKQFRSQMGFWGFLINIYYLYFGMLWRNATAGLRYGYRFAEVFYKFR